MTTVLLPITLTTAAILGLMAVVLAVRAGAARGRHKIFLGDGGNAEVLTHMRVHANFVEYVPLLLILMGLAELAGGSPLVLTIFGVVLVLSRVFHAVGMGDKPTVARAIGTAGSILLLVAAALYALIITWYAWSPTAA